MIDYFVGAPFALLADRASAQCWAGRRDILTELEAICTSFAMRPDSSISLMWANLGAGKTHALLHLGHMLRRVNAVPVYIEMPQQPKRFIDLYQRIVGEISTEDLLDAGASNPPQELGRALHVLQHGEEAQRELVRSWLSGGRPSLRELRSASNINFRIEDDTRACDMLSTIAAAFQKRGRRFVILLDEFQRISGLSTKQRENVLAHVRSVFSRNPSRFSMIVAVASRIEKTALDLLPRELRTLMGVQPTIMLPEMNSAEALEFVMGRLAAFRPAGYVGDPTAPFGSSSIQTVIDFISSRDNGRLIPRVLLQALGILFVEAASDLRRPLDDSRVRHLLEKLRWDD